MFVSSLALFIEVALFVKGFEFVKTGVVIPHSIRIFSGSMLLVSTEEGVEVTAANSVAAALFFKHSFLVLILSKLLFVFLFAQV